jgi:aminomethyltransferase
MRAAWLPWRGQDCRVARCGYTGEDGFEISAPAAVAEELARALLANPRLKLAGLGARDSLRLEAGLCLYGNELNEQTTPIEAGLVWTIPPARRNGGNYAGASAIAAQIKDGAPRRLLGLLPQGKAPARQGAALYNDEARVGAVASGGFSPTLQKPIAIAFVDKNANLDNLSVELRGKKIACERAALPFVAHRYHK